MKNLLVYCDESTLCGKYFSNFYGAAILDFNQLQNYSNDLNSLKESLEFKNELKWSKIKDYHHKVDRYIEYINYFFDEYIKTGKIKIRIMFTQNLHEYSGIEYSEEERYFKLYYQLIKNGLGLKYRCTDEKVNLYLYFDTFPHRSKINNFRNYLSNLSHNQFNKSYMLIKSENIAEIDSKQHIILQSLDLILGSMQFKLNKKDDFRIKPRQIPKRTRAKTLVYKAIYSKINEIHKEICPNKKCFNIGTSTGINNNFGLRWQFNYSHWLFVPKEHKINLNYKNKEESHLP